MTPNASSPKAFHTLAYFISVPLIVLLDRIISLPRHRFRCRARLVRHRPTLFIASSLAPMPR